MEDDVLRRLQASAEDEILALYAGTHLPTPSDIRSTANTVQAVTSNPSPQASSEVGARLIAVLDARMANVQGQVLTELASLRQAMVHRLEELQSAPPSLPQPAESTSLVERFLRFVLETVQNLLGRVRVRYPSVLSQLFSQFKQAENQVLPT